VIQFLCSETGSTSHDFQEFEKTHMSSYKPVKEFAELKRKLREKEEVQTKK
jgi:antirestriction protein